MSLQYWRDTRCHFDPDINKDSIDREPGWRPCFGQDGAAQSHLENQGVCEDDLFLFFGWFRKTVFNNGKLEFDPPEKGKHIIFGYLQIDEIKRVNNEFDIPKWLAYHPHVAEERRNVEPEKTKNTIYIARDNLSWNSSLPGAGRLVFNDKLVLTKEGFSRSKWNLPDSFSGAKISYHNDNSRKGGYFQSAAIGQEFVIKDNDRVEEWAKGVIEGSQIES